MAITLPFVLNITGGANMVAGSSVTVENITQFDATDPEKNKLRAELDATRKVSVDLANLRSGWNVADKIRICVTGARTGCTVYTIEANKSTKPISVAQQTSAIASTSITL